ncbi:membrane glycoprotein E3 CR1-gamma [Human adenovirus 11]|nr:membrane glycoprotein E3 CR1-gamma [Human adenovirus 11]WPC87312.1 membrane glycoprotein E3 CR1-gamma [Human adenovirus 11]
MVSTTTLLMLTSLATLTSARSHLTVTIGSNCTLKGPQGGHVFWWRIYDNGWFTKPCDQPGRFFCNGRDLTIVNVTASDKGFYYGTDYQTSLDYNIIVLPSTTPAPRKTTFSSSSAANNTISNPTFAALLKRTVNNSTTSHTTISILTISIIAAVTIGISILVFTITYYACCYRKDKHKGDPLLRFDI